MFDYLLNYIGINMVTFTTMLFMRQFAWPCSTNTWPSNFPPILIFELFRGIKPKTHMCSKPCYFRNFLKCNKWSKCLTQAYVPPYFFSFLVNPKSFLPYFVLYHLASIILITFVWSLNIWCHFLVVFIL